MHIEIVEKGNSEFKAQCMVWLNPNSKYWFVKIICWNLHLAWIFLCWMMFINIEMKKKSEKIMIRGGRRRSLQNWVKKMINWYLKIYVTIGWYLNEMVSRVRWRWGWGWRNGGKRTKKMTKKKET